MIKLLFGSRTHFQASRNFSSPASKAKMFDKILIANRGEIACRVIRTAKRMGVKTVAVYSDADVNSQHVLQADEAYHIGPAPSKESYLRGDMIIAKAKESGAQAIHPGYGFLSENAEFAEECTADGITFIGPPSSAIRSMASKSASKNIMINAKVPVIPGYHGEDQSIETLKSEAGKIGYPVMLKAVLGGGGKGMRLVESADEFEEKLEACRREAMKSFKDDVILIEKFLVNPRHIEFQIFGDSQGNVVHLYERDCSLQRRHQKILEEAPAPFMTKYLRDTMGEAAVNAAKAVNYVGAGTVEFMLDCDSQQFYFMEMNTRLQVEHPVTEMVTGQDLVEWQLKVASGMKLPLKQSKLQLNGHAFEARIYAENPRNNFLPGSGKLIHLREPNINNGSGSSDANNIRVETGVVEGDEVSIHYDPMIAKLVVWGPDRNTALKKIGSYLGQYEISGLPTNIEFVKKTSEHDVFVKGGVTTNFLDRNLETLIPERKPSPLNIINLAALSQILLNQPQDISSSASTRTPWDALDGFRVNSFKVKEFSFEDASGTQSSVAVKYLSSNSFEMEINKEIFNVSGYTLHQNTTTTTTSHTNLIHATINGMKCKLHAVQNQDTLDIFTTTVGNLNHYQLKTINNLDFGTDEGVSDSSVLTPMPGKIVKVLVQPGDSVKKGDALMIMEAMKMEHVIESPSDTVIDSTFFKENDFVEDGKVLLNFCSHSSTSSSSSK